MENGGIVDVAARLRDAARVTILTGAGVSAASGVPTFRGADGVWQTHRAEELATPDAFRRNPSLVWGWYNWRRSLVAACTPNAAHEVIARWSRERLSCRVITQNVDDLHVNAGTLRLIRLHGSIWELACFGIRGQGDACARGRRPWVDVRTPVPGDVPSCRYCGGLARPAVVWFGEALDRGVLQEAAAATRCDLWLTVGTSAVVYPAAGLVHEARRQGAYTVEINPDATPASGSVHLTLRGPAERILPAIDAAMSASDGS
jgi:NAD-dependent deacetylase